MTQQLAVADILTQKDVFTDLISRPITVVYSDPPWNPGNEKWWRRHADVEPPDSYDALLDAWCSCVTECRPAHIFCEHSAIPRHRAMMMAAIERCREWTLPLQIEWTVYYGSPKRPNVLLHFGTSLIATDPAGMSGEAMTLTALVGLGYPPGVTIADPCIGKGMVSRLAHKLGWNCVGTELNPKRLDRTIEWLLKHGYRER